MSAGEDPNAPAKFLGDMLSTVTSEVAFLAVEIASASCEMAVMGEAMAAESKADILDGAKALRARADSIQRRMVLAADALSRLASLPVSNIVPFPGTPGKDA